MSTYFPVSKTAILEGNAIASKKQRNISMENVHIRIIQALTDQLCFPFSVVLRNLAKKALPRKFGNTLREMKCWGVSAEASQLLLYAAVKLTRCSGIRKGAHCACPSVYPLLIYIFPIKGASSEFSS